jgi:hypothetical protein
MSATHSDLSKRMLFPENSPIYNDEGLRNILWHAHGFLLSAAFLFVFPIGIVAIRSGSPRSFRYHWLIQASATILALTGCLVGYATSKGVVLWHQYIGIFFAFALIAQVLAGWRHHVNFVQIKRRTWVSYVHLWFGRAGMGLAWFNIMLGLNLRGYNFLVKAGAVIAMLGMTTLWVLWGFGLVKPRANSTPQVGKQGPAYNEIHDREGLMRGDGDFVLDDLDDEDDEDDGKAKHAGN